MVVDMVYARGARRRSRGGRGAGAPRFVDGLEVLVRQGALSLELWTGREAPIEAMRAARA